MVAVVHKNVVNTTCITLHHIASHCPVIIITIKKLLDTTSYTIVSQIHSVIMIHDDVTLDNYFIIHN